MRFIDRGYTENSINFLLENCKKIIDKINEINECPEEFKDMQFLIFSGMVSYYGYEYMNTLIETFRNTTIMHKSIDEFVKDENGNREDYDETTPAITIRRVGINLPSFKLMAANLIYIFSECVYTGLDLLEIITHEYNHSVNSTKRTIFIKNFKIVERTGCAINFNGRIVEETVNTLQSSEIINHILGFTFFNINNKEIAKIINIYKEYASKKSNGFGYNREIVYMRELYEDKLFNDIVVNGRITGNIEQIEEVFDLKTYPGAYQELLIYFDLLYQDTQLAKDDILRLTRKYTKGK